LRDGLVTKSHSRSSAAWSRRWRTTQRGLHSMQQTYHFHSTTALGPTFSNPSRTAICPFLPPWLHMSAKISHLSFLAPAPKLLIDALFTSFYARSGPTHLSSSSSTFPNGDGWIVIGSTSLRRLPHAIARLWAKLCAQCSYNKLYKPPSGTSGWLRPRTTLTMGTQCSGCMRNWLLL
jgi:hypothetical protein